MPVNAGSDVLINEGRIYNNKSGFTSPRGGCDQEVSRRVVIMKPGAEFIQLVPPATKSALIARRAGYLTDLAGLLARDNARSRISWGSHRPATSQDHSAAALSGDDAQRGRRR